ncbi:unnamed protein product [Orchesella dallaii]|uniref:protein-serine/threonine phosphatase n=1 Tax=Orchesella dallaii TaxID=48710 RepID=A0ABP1PR57_9HEXA
MAAKNQFGATSSADSVTAGKKPVTKKPSVGYRTRTFYAGSSYVQGWGESMEDTSTLRFHFDNDDPEAGFFGVFDGHGGKAISEHAAYHLHKFVIQTPEYQDGDIGAALRQGFLQFDGAMMHDEQMKNEGGGSTAVTVFIKNDQLYCGNAGDSRAVASLNGLAHPLSSEHKPSNPKEAIRIKDAGGWVQHNRINDNLAISRGFGDFLFKRNSSKSQEEQMVIAFPDVEQRTVTEDYEFVILATKPVWDVITNEEAVQFIRIRLGNRMEPKKVCEELLTNCISPHFEMGGLGCDNMTVILVCFLHGKTWEHFCNKIVTTVTIKTELDTEESQETCLRSTSGRSDDEDLNSYRVFVKMPSKSTTLKCRSDTQSSTTYVKGGIRVSVIETESIPESSGQVQVSAKKTNVVKSGRKLSSSMFDSSVTPDAEEDYSDAITTSMKTPVQNTPVKGSSKRVFSTSTPHDSFDVSMQAGTSGSMGQAQVSAKETSVVRSGRNLRSSLLDTSVTPDAKEDYSDAITDLAKTPAQTTTLQISTESGVSVSIPQDNIEVQIQAPTPGSSGQAEVSNKKANVDGDRRSLRYSPVNMCVDTLINTVNSVVAHPISNKSFVRNSKMADGHGSEAEDVSVIVAEELLTQKTKPHHKRSPQGILNASSTNPQKSLNESAQEVTPGCSSGPVNESPMNDELEGRRRLSTSSTDSTAANGTEEDISDTMNSDCKTPNKSFPEPVLSASNIQENPTATVELASPRASTSRVVADLNLGQENLNFDSDVPWICSFCRLGPHVKVRVPFNSGWAYPYAMGDLFGPYYANLPSVYGNSSSRRETWMHGDCALWAGRLLLVNTTLKYLEETLMSADKNVCSVCGKNGATISCHERKGNLCVHFPCAKLTDWKLDNTNFLAYCPKHNASSRNPQTSMVESAQEATPGCSLGPVNESPMNDELEGRRRLSTSSTDSTAANDTEEDMSDAMNCICTQRKNAEECEKKPIEEQESALATQEKSTDRSRRGKAQGKDLQVEGSTEVAIKSTNEQGSISAPPEIHAKRTRRAQIKEKAADLQVKNSTEVEEEEQESVFMSTKKPVKRTRRGKPEVDDLQVNNNTDIEGKSTNVQENAPEASKKPVNRARRGKAKDLQVEENEEVSIREHGRNVSPQEKSTNRPRRLKAQPEDADLEVVNDTEVERERTIVRGSVSAIPETLVKQTRRANTWQKVENLQLKSNSEVEVESKKDQESGSVPSKKPVKRTRRGQVKNLEGVENEEESTREQESTSVVQDKPAKDTRRWQAKDKDVQTEDNVEIEEPKRTTRAKRGIEEIHKAEPTRVMRRRK